MGYYFELCERVREFASRGLGSTIIAQRLEAEGYRSLKLVEGFGRQGVRKLMRRLGLCRREKRQNRREDFSAGMSGGWGSWPVPMIV